MTAVAVIGAGAGSAGDGDVVVAASVGEALRSGAELLWWLEGVPAPGALGRLLEVARSPGAPPVVTGLVVDGAGRPVDRLTPRGKQLDIEALLGSAAQRRLPVRYAELAHTLVARAAVERHGPPLVRYGRYAAQEWTARILAGGSGWLVPASRATVEDDRDPPGGVRDLPATLRMARTGVWSRGEVMRAFAALMRRTGATRPGGPAASGP